MWFAGGKKRPLISPPPMAAGIMVLIIFTLVFQSVRGIRSFPGNNDNNDDDNVNAKDVKEESNADLFAKYVKLNMTSIQFNSSSSTLDEYKRRVPSCPDPLHNK